MVLIRPSLLGETLIDFSGSMLIFFSELAMKNWVAQNQIQWFNGW
jgi:hypothetical protein